MHTLDISQGTKPKFSNVTLSLSIPGMESPFLGSRAKFLNTWDDPVLGHNCKKRLGHFQNQNRRRDKGMRKILKESRKEIKSATDFKKTCTGPLDSTEV